VTIAYFSFNSKRTKAYTLDPYRLVYYRGGLYLYARAEEYGEVRTFAVERVQKIEVLDASFETPADFNVSEYARGAFGIAGGKAEAVGSRSTPRWRASASGSGMTRMEDRRRIGDPEGAGDAGFRASGLDQGFLPVQVPPLSLRAGRRGPGTGAPRFPGAGSRLLIQGSRSVLRFLLPGTRSRYTLSQHQLNRLRRQGGRESACGTSSASVALTRSAGPRPPSS
jgi:hypothetical protein